MMNITASPDIGLHELNEACSIIREASDSDDLQLNFGVIAKEEMGDTVKVTIIATGFSKVDDIREPAIEALPPSDFFAERAAGSGPAPSPVPAMMEPVAPAAVETAPIYEDDLDVPAYLRQGKLLN